MGNALLQTALFLGLLVVIAPLLGTYLCRVYNGETQWAALLERPVLAAIGGRTEPTGWVHYALAVLAVNFAGFVLLYLILSLQHVLPMNGAALPGLAPALAFNTAISFVTNTNWQAYGGESTMSGFSQMVGLGTQNFLSAGTGMAVAAAVVRGFAARESRSIGNFTVDLTRSIIYVLLPFSILLALLLAWQGVPQTLASGTPVTTLEGAAQTLAHGPVASQVAIKQLGTNGGGFFNVNSAHPFENPTPLSNFLQLVSILAIPVGFAVMFGRMVGDRRQGWALFAAMGVLLIAGIALVVPLEAGGNALLAGAPIDQAAGNMEGKEVRFGTLNSALWAVATTDASNGSVNAMHDSFQPLSGLVLMLNMQLGEIVYGGVGAGLYGMLLFVILTVFIAGLMVGRTPEYLGKKIEAHEVKLAMIALLSVPLGTLGLGALAATLPDALASVQDKGPHGLSEIIYNYTSAVANNGSAFAGWNGATPYHLTTQGIAMMLGRFAVIVPMLAIAGGLAAKRVVPPSAGTFPTHTPLFVTLLVVVILIIGGLTFFPVLALGPIAEHLALAAGKSF